MVSSAAPGGSVSSSFAARSCSSGLYSLTRGQTDVSVATPAQPVRKNSGTNAANGVSICLMKLPISPGVYAVRNNLENKVYVGSTRSLAKRRRKHWNELASGTHANKRLQQAWELCGASAFVFEVLEPAEDHTRLIVLEQIWIDRLQSADPEHGYNMTPVAGPGWNKGIVTPQAVRDKISATNRGNPSWSKGKKLPALSANHRRVLSERTKGRRLSQEWRDAISASRVGMKLSAAHKANISAARKGQKSSPSAIQNIRSGLYARETSTNTSGHRGVSWDTRAGRWRAVLVYRDGDKKRTRHLGYFDSVDAAVEMRRQALKQYLETAAPQP